MRRGRKAISLILFLAYGALQGCSYRVMRPVSENPDYAAKDAIKIDRPVTISAYTTVPDVRHEWRGRVASCEPDSLCFEVKAVFRPSGVLTGERFVLARSEVVSVEVEKFHRWRSFFLGLLIFEGGALVQISMTGWL